MPLHHSCAGLGNTQSYSAWADSNSRASNALVRQNNQPENIRYPPVRQPLKMPYLFRSIRHPNILEVATDGSV